MVLTAKCDNCGIERNAELIWCNYKRDGYDLCKKCQIKYDLDDLKKRKKTTKRMAR